MTSFISPSHGGLHASHHRVYGGGGGDRQGQRQTGMCAGDMESKAGVVHKQISSHTNNTAPSKPLHPNQSTQTSQPKPVNQTSPPKPVHPNQSTQTSQPNQSTQTSPSKPVSPNQSNQTSPSKPVHPRMQYNKPLRTLRSCSPGASVGGHII